MPPQSKSSVEDVQRQLDRAVARIHEDLDLTAEAQNRLVREVYEKARDQVSRDVEDGREDLEADLRVARRMAFAPPVVEGKRIDESHVARWYADEVDKVRQIREPKQLEQRFQDALLINNLCAAKAILVRAYELRNNTLVGRYFESFPDERDVWDNFIEAAEAYNEWERAQRLFSTPNRLKPLESYLA
ncbi:MAG TPA: hypothetical protein VNA27_12490 [Rubrobacteraceae bacterium]|nr:hypothetical protein [Rubrobacteraceae bacterium]